MRLPLVSLVCCLVALPLAASAATTGPTGTFGNDAGEVVLEYLGEGSVKV